MNKTEIRYILETAGYTVVNNKVGPTPLIGITNFNENRFIDPERTRYEFDFENQLLKVYIVKKYPYDTVPSNWRSGTYDYFNDRIYRYLCDDQGYPIVDYIDFASIDVIGIDDTLED